jgi:MFS family permease
MERRLVLVVSAVVFVDTTFYAVIAPLLPTLAHDLHLSKLSAGVMTASYPVGTLVGSLPGGVLAVRVGPKQTVAAGLVLLAGSTIAFAFLHDVVALDGARFVEGLGGACSWAGGLAWIVAETAAARRGALIGRALGAAIGGSLFGPVIGTLANAVGRRAAFSGVVIVSVLLIAKTRRLPSHHVRSGQGLGEMWAGLAGRGIRMGMWLVTLPAVASGALNVLGPLRLHRFGASAAVIGATFLAAAGAEAVITPVIGSWSDRRGRLVPLRLGLVVTAVLLLCFSLPSAVFVLAAVVVAIAAALGTFWAPAMAMLSGAAERHGLDEGLAGALMNLAWAAGQTLGSGAGGSLANATSDSLPILITAGLCAATLAVISRKAIVRRLAQ